MLKISFVLILIFSYAGIMSVILIYLCTCEMLRCRHLIFGALFYIFSVIRVLASTQNSFKIKIAATNNSNHCCKNACSQGESNPQLVLRRTKVQLSFMFTDVHKSQYLSGFFAFRISSCSPKSTVVVRCLPAQISSFLDFAKKGKKNNFHLPPFLAVLSVKIQPQSN